MSLNLNKITKIVLSAAVLTCLMCSCGAEEKLGQISSEGVMRNQYRLSANGIERVIPEAEPMPQIICIDPGHGFDDGGCSSEFLNGLNEDDITLAISLKLRDELNRLGYQVILTHDGQSFPKSAVDNGNNKFSPEERTSYANSIKSDYFVSIHCNSYKSSDASGTIIYYYDSESKKERTSGDIAESIKAGILGSVETGRNLRTEQMTTGAYYVVKHTTVPASLIETGFVTNESDAAYLLDSDWQQKFAKGIADGIDKYYRADQN